MINLIWWFFSLLWAGVGKLEFSHLMNTTLISLTQPVLIPNKCPEVNSFNSNWGVYLHIKQREAIDNLINTSISSYLVTLSSTKPMAAPDGCQRLYGLTPFQSQHSHFLGLPLLSLGCSCVAMLAQTPPFNQVMDYHYCQMLVGCCGVIC